MASRSTTTYHSQRACRGGSNVEYVVMLALVALGLVGAVKGYMLTVKRYSCDQVMMPLETNVLESEGAQMVYWDPNPNSQGRHCVKEQEIEGDTIYIYLF